MPDEERNSTTMLDAHTPLRHSYAHIHDSCPDEVRNSTTMLGAHTPLRRSYAHFHDSCPDEERNSTTMLDAHKHHCEHKMTQPLTYIAAMKPEVEVCCYYTPSESVDRIAVSCHPAFGRFPTMCVSLRLSLSTLLVLCSDHICCVP